MRLIRSAVLFSSSLVLSTALASPAAAPGRLTLKYFDGRGRAETARILLALAGEEYDDHRYAMTPGKMESAAFLAAKEAGDLKANLGKAPLLITADGVEIGQSHAIERYLARELGFMGSTPVEEALVDCVAEHCRDVRDAQFRKGFSAFLRDKTDEEKAALRAEWFDTDLPAVLGKIDEAIRETGTGGFAVGNKRSLADVAIWSMLKDCYPPYAEDTAKSAEGCAALKAVVESVDAEPTVRKWVEERPETLF
eukprot:CAMPEP_0183292692 /NCGR_PEP_ID=MMETSP0160_2-20130417/1657_1 /TAXON_ID=2839 ORGANISM="Odontella Sinensis, Strain Grunow 1884" /NCGR_SAMPLE_ID=MMETSP0160_2 /ASSEMBLY_ACC=CAM_ASM_000250 /LENGTH=251 /DNA_ID=CAMNT_0025453685 /DNA_START=66 /DNA_END=821 /DNA_ORIENTATION=-